MDNNKLMTEEEWLAKHQAEQAEKNKKKKLKNTLRNVIALVLVVVISVGGTLAYLKIAATPKTNVFKGSAGLDLILTETKWDPSNNDDTLPAPDDGDAKEAQTYKSGTTYNKNPQLVNTSAFDKITLDQNNAIDSIATDQAKYDEYVAIKIDFQDSAGSKTYSDILTVINAISFDTNNWLLVDAKVNNAWVGSSNVSNTDLLKADGSIASKNDLTGKTNILNATSFIFIYADTANGTPKKLLKDNATEALYPSITTLQSIPSTVGGGDSVTGNFPTFKLIMSGAAVDADSFTNTATVTEKLVELLH